MAGITRFTATWTRDTTPECESVSVLERKSESVCVRECESESVRMCFTATHHTRHPTPHTPHPTPDTDATPDRTTTQTTSSDRLTPPSRAVYLQRGVVDFGSVLGR